MTIITAERAEILARIADVQRYSAQEKTARTAKQPASKKQV